MSLSYTYGTLYAALQSMAEDTNVDFQNFIPDIVQKGELRVIRDLDLDNLDASIATTAINQATGIVAKPTNLIRERDVIVQQAGADVVFVNRRTYSFLREYLLSAAGIQGIPKYYAETDQNNWVIGPLPSAANYTLNVRGIYPPTTLGDNTQYTSLAAAAALQHTTAATPLTLTTSPYIFAPAPCPIALTSSANMSANNFTIVGTDINGVALTVVLAGPNANTVQTTEFFTQITSITPSATDAVNFVSIGYSQANTTWISTRLGDLLFMSCFIDANHFLKRFTAREIAKTEYAARLQASAALMRNLKRSDIDDIVVGRVLQGQSVNQASQPPQEGKAQLGPQLTGL